MNTDKLIIPTKCKVGFNTRGDTYTGKLGYIIYNDGKVWRKEPSWESWKQNPGQIINTHNGDYKWYNAVLGEDFLPIEFDNIPTEGFVLNKKAGGGRYSWNPRQTYCRVYDPRGWEFEITIPNLLFILECSNSMKGKGIEGEFVYSWDGKDLVLLPCNSDNFQSSKQFTELQKGKVEAKNLKVGATYIDKSGNNLLYLGKLERVKEIPNGTETYKDRYGRVYEKKLYKKVVQKSYAFYGTPSRWRHGYEVHENLSKIKSLTTEVIPENFATILEGYYTNIKTKLDE